MSYKSYPDRSQESILKNSSTDRMVSEAAPVESQAHNEKADPGFIYGTYDPVVITI